MLVWVSRQASLQCSLQYGLCYCTWTWFSREVLSVMASGKWIARQVSLPVTYQDASIRQPDKLTWSCDYASHVLRHHVESPLWKDLTPGVFPLLVRAPRSCRITPYPELGALTKLLASRCQFECLGRLLYSLVYGCRLSGRQSSQAGRRS